VVEDPAAARRGWNYQRAAAGAPHTAALRKIRAARDDLDRY